jgi:hypothetical protein
MQSKSLLISTVDPKQSIDVIQNQITPVIQWATNWGINAGFGMLGVVLFYQVVIILVKPDK